MLTPTLEHLTDPYVLQLVDTIAKLDDRVKDLEAQLLVTEARLRFMTTECRRYETYYESLLRRTT